MSVLTDWTVFWVGTDYYGPELSVLTDWNDCHDEMYRVPWRTKLTVSPGGTKDLKWMSWRTEKRVLRKWTECIEEMNWLSWWGEFRILTNWMENPDRLKGVYWQAGLNIPTVLRVLTNEFTNKRNSVRSGLIGLNNYST